MKKLDRGVTRASSEAGMWISTCGITFQMMLNDIFKQLIDEGVVTIYMDNILIFGGGTKEPHHEIVVHVLDILQKHCLYLMVEKCTFEWPIVEYLSLILLEGHMELSPVKVAGIIDWLTPRNVTKSNHS